MVGLINTATKQKPISDPTQALPTVESGYEVQGTMSQAESNMKSLVDQQAMMTREAQSMAPTSGPGLVEGYTGEGVNVNAKQDTVQGQIQGIIDKNSPLMRSAATRARQGVNQRGLVNTSMGIQAGQQAVIDSALPIADRDAATYFDANKTSVDARNKATEFTASEANRARLSAQESEQRQTETGVSGEEERKTQAAGGVIEQGLMDRKAEIDELLLTADGEVRKELLQEQGVIDTQLQKLRGNQAVEQIQQRGNIEERMQEFDRETQESLLEIEGAQAISRIEENRDAEKALMLEKERIDDEMFLADAITKAGLMDRQAEIEKELTNLRFENDQTMQADRLYAEALMMQADGQIKERLMNLGNDLDVRLANINNENKLLLQTSQSSAMMYSSTMQAIGEILSDPDIPNDTGQKIDLVNQQMDALEHGMTIMQATQEGLDLTQVLSFDLEKTKEQSAAEDPVFGGFSWEQDRQNDEAGGPVDPLEEARRSENDAAIAAGEDPPYPDLIEETPGVIDGATGGTGGTGGNVDPNATPIEQAVQAAAALPPDEQAQLFEENRAAMTTAVNDTVARMNTEFGAKIMGDPALKNEWYTITQEVNRILNDPNATGEELLYGPAALLREFEAKLKA